MTTLTFAFEFGKLDEAMSRPQGVDIRQDRIAVVDFDLCRVQLFDLNGQLLEVWGQLGSDPGDFWDPRDVALGPGGEVYVADQGNNRVQAFAPNGALLWVIGGLGTMLGHFDRPRGICVDEDGAVFVSDTENSRVQVLDQSGTARYELLATAPPVLNGASALLVDKGELFSANTRQQTIVVGEAKGGFVRDWQVQPTIVPIVPPPAFDDGPTGIAMDASGHLLVADTRTSEILTYERDGTFVGSLGRRGAGRGEFDKPSSLGRQDDRLVVADSLNRRVVVTDTRLRSWQIIGGAPSPAGHLAAPRHTAYDPAKDIVYVVDQGNQRVQAFAAATGAFQFELTAAGMDDPFGVAVAGREVLVTNNTYIPRVFRFRGPGQVSFFNIPYPAGASISRTVHGIAVDPRSGDIWIADHHAGLLLQLDAQGVLGRYAVIGGGVVANTPTDVVVTDDGRLFVADPANERILLSGLGAPMAFRFVEDAALAGVMALAVDAERELVYAIKGTRVVVVELRAQPQPLVTEYLGWGGGPAELRGGAGIALTPDGSRLFVSEWENHRVQAFDVAA